MPCPRLRNAVGGYRYSAGHEDRLRAGVYSRPTPRRAARRPGRRRCDQVFVDKASGKLARRPELDRALLVAWGGDQLVVTKLDRLGRSLEHLIGLSKDLQARGVDLVVLDQGIDTSAAVGRMFFQILGASAEFSVISTRRHGSLPEVRAAV